MSIIYPSFAIEGPARSGKTTRLVSQAVNLLNAEPADGILILSSNFYRKARFMEALQTQLKGSYPQLSVTTYSALVRNTLSLHWPLVEEILSQGGKGEAVIFPELAGFESSEYLLKKIIAHVQHNNPMAFNDFQGSQKSLIKQLIRRLRLRSENRLTRVDMRERSGAIGEICVVETDQVMGLYDYKSAELRVLDNSRQIDVFHHLLEKNPVVQEHFQQRIKHLIADDIDETIPAQQHFIKWLAPTLNSIALSCDPEGGTRRGYLNAYPYDWEALKTLKPNIETISLTRNDAFCKIAGNILHNWLHPDEKKLLIPPSESPTPHPSPLPKGEGMAWQAHTVTRMEMLDQVVSDVERLLHAGTPAGYIAIIMPRVDTIARMMLEQQMKRRGILLQMLTGTQRPTDNPVCSSLLLLIQLANYKHWQLALSPLELKGLLRSAFKLHHIDSAGLENLITEYRQGMLQGCFDLPSGDHLNEPAQQRYNQLLNWLAEASDKELDEQIFSGFSDVLSMYLSENDALADMSHLTRSLYIFRTAMQMQGDLKNPHLAAREWLIQIKTGIVADTPNKPREVDKTAMVLGTPQKIIDFEIARPIQLWLDCTSREWSRTDMAPLYNAWLHSVNWDGTTTDFSDGFFQMLTRIRAGHMTRTLTLYANDTIRLYASELDNEGMPHLGHFHEILQLSDEMQSTEITRATLRDDQAGILNYKTGPMAIAAVPGAGKTFINVELCLKLIAEGTAPERILVLTYMDSAARTVLSRIKAKLPSRSALPVISTIHSLAFRMLMEDEHCLHLGFDASEIEIIDDIESQAVMEPLWEQLDGQDRYFSKPDMILSAISLAKSLGLHPQDLKNRYKSLRIQSGILMKFIQLYEAYQNQLKRLGKLDFTDLILNAIQLLKTRPEILEKYQERFLYVIEDEAQDSSKLLQTFIGLLTQKHQNLIRTGDTNQSITTTFSSADTDVFRDFILGCEQEGIVIRMTHSARSAEPVLKLSNSFTAWALEDEFLKNAFQAVTVSGVGNYNPEILMPITSQLFESAQDESNWMVDTVKTFQANHPAASVAVLVRNNSDVMQTAKILQKAGIRAVCQSDHPATNPVFMVIVNVMKLLEDPVDKNALDALLTQMNALNLIFLSDDEKDKIVESNFFHSTPETLASNGALLQLFYNMHDLARDAYGKDICHLIVRISDLFFESAQERTVGYLCALKAQGWVDNYFSDETFSYLPPKSALEVANDGFLKCIQKKRLPFRSPIDIGELLQNRSFGFVLVMTVHKSKGQEFDCVFLPGLYENAYASAPESVRWQTKDKLELQLENLSNNGSTITKEKEEELILLKKLKKIEEEARLVYVGITRARQALFMSCPLQRPWFGKPESLTPSRFFFALDSIAAALAPAQPEEVVNYGAN